MIQRKLVITAAFVPQAFAVKNEFAVIKDINMQQYEK